MVRAPPRTTLLPYTKLFRFDIMETKEGELTKMADNADKLEMLNKYFTVKDPFKQ